MPDFAFHMIQQLMPVYSTFFWLGAFQPHCGDSGEPMCTYPWTGWQWVDGTSNDNLDCGALGCGTPNQ
jgi:hypothetical protein